MQDKDKASKHLTRRSFIGSGLAAASLTPGVTSSLANTPTSAMPKGLFEPGFNLPGWVTRQDGQQPSITLLKTLYHLGFRTIRLPVDPTVINMDRNAIDSISDATRFLQDLGFSVTLDLHPEQDLIDLFEIDDIQAAVETTNAWIKLAKACQNLPAAGTFLELLNEPPMERETWLKLRAELVEIVRQTCLQHTIVWGAARYQDIYQTMEYPLLDDANSVPAVHYYTPIGFTHQCANWSGPDLERVGNLPFPASNTDLQVVALRQELERESNQSALDFLNQEFEADWTKARIDDDFRQLGDWAKQNNTPVVLNEFGVLNFCVDAQSRINWITQVRNAAVKNTIGWTYWEFDRGFGFVEDRLDPNTIDFSIASALLTG